ncbi:MAG TPA: ABC transporter permease [Geminicoccaceae bacterium]|nr:ABC transporter permease [Geminicoccus sp.]HMU50853.1 ABC transporter permease [Geminicoccaceae bacterium]
MSSAGIVAAAVTGSGGRSVNARAWAKLRRHRLGMTGLVLLGLVVLAAVLAPLIAPYDPTEVHYEALMVPPSAEFWLGTDEIGRDILSRLIYGARVSLEVVMVSILAALVVGSAIGLVSGYAGGRVDSVVMRIMDGLLAFPLLVLALGIIAVLGPSLINATIAIAVVNVPGFARLVRGQVLVVRELDFVQAARSLGAGHLRIMLKHIWPNVAGNVIVYASLRASSALITESSLAFLGLGAEPPTPSWGQMLATAMEYWDAWWMSVFAGLAIFIAALAFNFLGDGLRDALDARIDD